MGMCPQAPAGCCNFALAPGGIRWYPLSMSQLQPAPDESKPLRHYVEFTKDGVRRRISIEDAHNPEAFFVDLIKSGAEKLEVKVTREILPEGPL